MKDFKHSNKIILNASINKGFFQLIENISSKTKSLRLFTKDKIDFTFKDMIFR